MVSFSEERVVLVLITDMNGTTLCLLLLLLARCGPSVFFLLCLLLLLVVGAPLVQFYLLYRDKSPLPFFVCFLFGGRE